MKISVRIVLLVLLGFLITLSVAGIAVVSMSRMATEIGRLGNQDLPLIGNLTTISVTNLESAAALERALRAGMSPDFPGDLENETFTTAGARYSALAAKTEDVLSETIGQVTEAMRDDTDEASRAAFRTILGLLHEVGLTRSLHAGVAQRTLFLLEEGRQNEAMVLFARLDQQQAELTTRMSSLIERVEDLARLATGTAREHQQSYLWFMVATAMVGLTACLVLGWLIGQSVTQPIRAVTNALAELVRGNTEAALDIPGNQGETGAMGVALKAFRDEIIDRRKTVTALAESERRFHALAEVAPVGVFYTDPKGNTLYVNEMGCEVVGLSVVECLGQGWTRGIHPDDRENLLAGWQDSIAAEESQRSEFRLVKPDGTVTWVIGQVTPNRDADGNVAGFVGTITDITEQKEAEARLLEHAQSRTRLHEITADQSLSLDDKLHKLLALGTETFRLPLGIISHIETDAYTIQYICGPEGAPPPGTQFDLGETYCFHTLNANGPVGFHDAGKSRIADHPCYRKFGLESYIGSPLIVDGHRYGTLNFSGPEIRTQPFGDADFSLIQLFAQWIGNEISRQRAEDILRISEERLNLALEGTEDGLWDWNVPSGEVYFSPRWAAIIGMKPDDIQPHVSEWENRIHPDDRVAMTQALNDHLRGKTALYESEHRIRATDDSWVWVLDRGKVVQRADDGSPVRAVGTHTDITARKRAEDALRESEARVRLIVDNVVDGIITIDEFGTIRTVNPAIERIFGFGHDELLGRNVKVLMPSPYRENHDDYLRNYRESGEARIIGLGREVEGRRKDGTVFPMDLAVSEMIRGDGHLFTGIIRDITERKQVERMKSEFVSSVSHELRTPLTSIRGALGLIVGSMGDGLDKKVRDLVDIAFNNSQRLISLVNDILDLEKIGSGRMEFRLAPTDLVAVVKKALADNKGFADEHGIEFRLAEAPPIAWTRADGDRIAQVLANLLSNAAKFSPKGDTVEVSVSLHETAVRVSVADRGPGIPDEFRPRIFERFSQADSSDTRKVGGTGLGLSIVKAIIDHHGGSLGFESEVGAGTTFHFDLPTIQSPETEDAGAAGEGVGTPPAIVDGAHILICEDDHDIAKLLAVLLEQNGLTADVAHNATEAKALLRRNRYDAMTVDILLPGQDGIALIRDIRRNHKTRNLPIVVISATAEATRNELESTTLDIVDWLNKPIDENHLKRALTLATDHGPSEKPRLLYVEDDPDLVEIVTALVAKTARTTVAGSLAEARKKLKRGKFDLVILDVRLPDGSGLELLESLRDENGQPTPVIIFSGDEIEGDLAQRVDAALVKSRTSDIQLLETIRRLIAAGSGGTDGREQP